MELNRFYTVQTDSFRYGKSVNLKEAMDNARVNTRTKVMVITTCIIDRKATTEQVENLMKCFPVSKYGNIMLYDNPSAEDEKMVEDLVIGWTSEVIDRRKKKTEKKTTTKLVKS